MKPAVFGKSILCRFFIFIVAFHYILTPDLDFPYLIIGVIRIDTYFHDSFQDLSAGTGHIFIIVVVANQRPAFSHSVTDSKREFDFIQEIAHFLVHGSSTDNHFTEASSHSIHQMFTNLGINARIQQRNIQRQLHRCFAQLRKNHLFVYLFKNQRNGQNQVRLYLFKCFQQDFRRRNFSQHIDMGTYRHRYEEVESTAIGMCQRQEA